MGAQPLAKLPAIDFSKENLKPGTSCWSSTAIDARQALEQYGCSVAKYDKMSPQLHDSIFRELKELFDLPTEIKMKNISDKPYFGYAAGNSATTPHVPSLHESLGIENTTTLEAVQSFTNLMWPAGNHSFCETVLSYTKLVAELEQMVKRMDFESYGAEKYYDSHVGSTTYLLRQIKYRAPEIDESDVGCEIHTDKSFITILHQNEVEGFELKTKDGYWIGFEPSPSSFLVLAGDAFLAWSNDRIHSAAHRVVMKGSRERFSVGVFSYHNGIIEIPVEVVDEQHPLKFKAFEHYGLLNYFYTAPGPKTDSTAKAYCGL
ncbi:deoxypodophyllotoxin synthase [Ziziphus jujuba]|uniref:Deoxypodophyllotoxin synthase n=2 Tax=Ziziphus jujuba TaxID=326968 RepID=A0A6P3YXF4_ZIZJJ|nr:deoxypodophyllotoxin synthase [Ziziphus jujuba]KAH7547341.1 hypothetical protein FEM48_Zijuj01G0299500 [Ziziphus jujuba var. spinosa]